MARGRRSPGRPGAWVWLAVVAALALGGVVALPMLDLDPRLPLPWWTTLAVPALVYLAMSARAGRRSLPRAAAGFVVLCATHALLLAATAVLYATLDPVDSARALALAGWELPSVAALRLLAVPVMLAPFRDLLTPRPRPAPARVPRPVYPRPSRPVAVAAPEPGSVAPAPPPPAPPGPRPAAPPAVGPAPASPAPGEPQPAASDLPSLEPPSAPGPTTRPTRPPAAEPVDDVVRVSFARIADQLPADAFLLPLDRLAANLLEPGHLLVPQRLLLPQLAEGLAQVAWEVVADQFPGQALAVPDAEVARRIPGGKLVLPLDEIVRQLPPDVFLMPPPAVDVDRLESFPPPFQPHVPPPGEEPADARDEHGDDGPAPAGPPAAVEAAAPVAEDEPDEPAGVPAVEPDDVPAGATALAEAPRVPALPAPLMRALHVGRVEREGCLLTTVLSPAVEREAVLDTVLRLLPFLDDPRLPGGAEQATVRGVDAALVVTPLAAGARAVLVTAADSPASLAFLERWSLRAAATAVPAGAARTGRPFGTPGAGERPALPPTEAELRRAEVPAPARVAAETLRAFGRVTPSVLRDDREGVLFYVFLPDDLPARPVAAFARDLRRVLAGATLGLPTSVTFRFHTHRLVVQELERGLGRPAMLVAGGGPVDRPGLARVELERAARHLRDA